MGRSVLQCCKVVKLGGQKTIAEATLRPHLFLLFEGRSTFAPSFQLTQPPTFCHQCGAISSLSLPFLPTSFQSSPLWAIPASPVATTKQWGSPLIQVFQSVPKPWRGANPFRTCTWCPTTPCHRHPLNHHPSPCPLRTSIGNMKMRLLHRR